MHLNFESCATASMIAVGILVPPAGSTPLRLSYGVLLMVKVLHDMHNTSKFSTFFVKASLMSTV